MANDYTTLADVKASFVDSTSYSGTTDYDSVFSAWITTASRLIDNEVGRWPGFFAPSSDDETRYYDGSGSAHQKIDECLSITTLSVSAGGGLQSSDYDSWSSTDYWFEPYNYSALGRPFNTITIDVLNGGQTVFWHYPKAVKVAGIFGWATTCPSVIADAAKIQTIRWFMRSKMSFQDVSAGGAISTLAFAGKQELDPDVRAMLWPFKLELMP